MPVDLRARKLAQIAVNFCVEMKKGDKIITIGGIFGTIENVAEDSIVIKVESGATLRMAKSAVSVKRD